MIKTSPFQKYSEEKRVSLHEEEVSILLSCGLALAKRIARKPRIVDLGCGEGKVISALHRKGLLEHVAEVVGVDISESRIGNLKRELPFVRGIASDASNVRELPDFSFDFVICTQVIEHVKDDAKLILEIKRLLKKGGLVFISSVYKTRNGLYFYVHEGFLRLDPTHIREYSSQDQFEKLVGKEFEVIGVRTNQIMFQLFDFAVRLLARMGLVETDPRVYQKHIIHKKIRDLRVPILGYFNVEILARKIS